MLSSCKIPCAFRSPAKTRLAIEALEDRYLPSLGSGTFLQAGLGLFGSPLSSSNSKPLKLTGAGTLNLANHNLSASGTGTELGNWKLTGHGNVHPHHVVDGTVEFTAANGDHLDASFTGSYSPTDGTTTDTLTFTGGTGRYTGASGTADVSGAANLHTGAFTCSIDGTILLSKAAAVSHLLTLQADLSDGNPI